jgi:fused signal recognition particle receptor
MSGFFKKLFNRITGKSDEAPTPAQEMEALPAPEQEPTPEPEPVYVPETVVEATPTVQYQPEPTRTVVTSRVIEPTRTVEPVRTIEPLRTVEPVRTVSRTIEPVRTVERVVVTRAPEPPPPPEPEPEPEYVEPEPEYIEPVVEDITPEPEAEPAPPPTVSKKQSATEKLKSLWPFRKKKQEPVYEPEPKPAVVAPEPEPSPVVEVEIAKPAAKAKPEKPGKKPAGKKAKFEPEIEIEVQPETVPEPIVEEEVFKPIYTPEPVAFDPEPEPVQIPAPQPAKDKKGKGKKAEPEVVARKPEPAAAPLIADAPAPVVQPKAGALRKAPPAPVVPVPAPEPERKGLFARLKEGLSKSSKTISTQITTIFTKRKLDAATLQDLEDTLIQADLGITVAERIIKAVATGRYDKEVDPEEVKQILAAEVARVLAPVEVPFNFGEEKPHVILVVGVNGSGKTTTIGKLGAIAMQEGFKVKFAACDTFRAAAIEQLTVWGQRIGAETIWRPQGADAAGLAFDAMKAAKDDGTDILFIDTAGRLHNKSYLMDELDKVVRVIKKHDPGAPHAVLLVLDATTGQNALAQAEAFTKVAGVTGLIMTKLDGTARGGILVAIAEKFKLPIHAIGVGETLEDLQPFDADAFSRAIAGLDEKVAA